MATPEPERAALEARTLLEAQLAIQRALAERLAWLRSALGDSDLDVVAGILRHVLALCANAADIQAKLDAQPEALAASRADLAPLLVDLDRETRRVALLRGQVADLLETLTGLTHEAIIANEAVSRRLSGYAPSPQVARLARSHLLDQTA